MGAQYFCPEANEFILCDPKSIGKKVECSVCNDEHDVVPMDSPEGTQQAMVMTSPQENSEQKKSKRISKAGIIVAVIIFLSGFSKFGNIHNTHDIQSIFLVWTVGIILFIRSFFAPIRWWQGIMVFFGAGFVGIGLSQLFLSGNPIGVKLMTLLMAAGFATVLLFFGFRQFKKRQNNH